MRRTILTTLIAAGAVISLLTGSSLFAASTDRAETGASKFGTKGRAKKMDIQLATFNMATMQCEGWTDHLSTGLFDVTGAQEGQPVYGTPFCLQNNSPTAEATVAISAVDLLDIDVDCTGDEAFVDTTCGGDQPGELLAAPLAVYFEVYTGGACNTFIGQTSDLLSAYTAPHTFVTLAAGERACVRLYADSNLSEDAAERAQSDRVTWRFVFDAAIAPAA